MTSGSSKKKEKETLTLFWFLFFFKKRGGRGEGTKTRGPKSKSQRELFPTASREHGRVSSAASSVHDGRQAAPAPALTAVFEHTGGSQTSQPTHNIGNGDAASNQTAAHV